MPVPLGTTSPPHTHTQPHLRTQPPIFAAFLDASIRPQMASEGAPVHVPSLQWLQEHSSGENRMPSYSQD